MPEKSPPHKNIGEQDDMTADLARRIGTAIEEWKQKYQLEKIPSKILLDKAINIIRIMKETL